MYVFVRGTEVLQIIIAGLQGIVNNFFCKMYPVDFLYKLLYNVTVFVDFLCNSFMDAKELQNGVIVMNKKEKNILRAFVMVSQVSITILVPIALSGWIGWGVSHADMVSYNDRTWCRGSISQCLLSDKVLLFRRHEKGA